MVILIAISAELKSYVAVSISFCVELDTKVNSVSQYILIPHRNGGNLQDASSEIGISYGNNANWENENEIEIYMALQSWLSITGPSLGC